MKINKSNIILLNDIFTKKIVIDSFEKSFKPSRDYRGDINNKNKFIFQPNRDLINNTIYQIKKEY